MHPIQAVLFDYGMVISGPPDPAAWARMCTITGLDEDPLHRNYWAHRHAYDRGDLTGHAYWKKVGDNAGLVLTLSQIQALIAADLDLWGQINLPMLAWAQYLQRTGVTTGILSNIGDAMSKGLTARFDWLTHFNARTWSHVLNLAKPEPEIYRHAAESLHTAPQKILFIDDRSENIDAAIASGMEAIQYSDHPTFEGDMKTRGLGYLLAPPSSD